MLEKSLCPSQDLQGQCQARFTKTLPWSSMCKSVCQAQGTRSPSLQTARSRRLQLLYPCTTLPNVLSPLKESYLGMRHQYLIIEGPVKNHQCHGFLFGEVLPNLTNFPSHHHPQRLRPFPIMNKSAFSRIPFCLNLHYGTYHSSKEAMTHNVKAQAWGANRTRVLSLHFPPTTEWPQSTYLENVIGMAWGLNQALIVVVLVARTNIYVALCTKPYSKYFTYINSLNPPNTLQISKQA